MSFLELFFNVGEVTMGTFDPENHLRGVIGGTDQRLIQIFPYVQPIKWD